MKSIYLLFCVLIGFFSSATILAANDQNGSGETDGYKLVWQDLFDASEINPMRWEIEVNGEGGGNNELQYYTDDDKNVRLAKDADGNGCLILSAIRESYLGKNFTSGRIISKNRIAFTHGKIEASIKLPNTANGLWPAFWMMGNDFDMVGWPKCGEIDIMEFGNITGINAGTQDRYFNGACHWGPSWENHPMYANAITNEYSLQDGQFHLYTLIWTENKITMYVDYDKNPTKKPYYEMDITYQGENIWSPSNYFHKENFILFNLAVGGNFTGIHNADRITALGSAKGSVANMYVNYVRIYQKGTPDESTNFQDAGDSPAGINEIEIDKDNSIMICTSNKVTLPFVAKFTVYDMLGGKVLEEQSSYILLDNLSSGIYIVKAVAENGSVYTNKVIKK